MKIKDIKWEKKKSVGNIKGILTNTKKDAHGEQLTVEALEKAKKDFTEKPFIFHEHDKSHYPIGKLIKCWIEKKGDDYYELIGEAEILDKDYFDLIKSGKIKAFSVSFTT